METDCITNRTFGKTDQAVSMVGLGGEGILRTFGKEKAAEAVIREALLQGITYFDSARAYSGSESYYGRIWTTHPEDRKRIFQTSKSALRFKSEALVELDRTLTHMGIDHLDLWQIHDVRTQNDIERIEAPDGALEAFLEAKSSGKTRFIGVTGHHDPTVLTRAVTQWPVDAVLLPVNPVESVLGGFLDQTVAAAKEKGIAVIGMKVLGASHYISPQANVSAQDLIRFALSQPIDLAVVGCATPDEVRTLANAGRRFEPMPFEDQNKLTDLFRPHARRLAYYRGRV